MVAPPPFTTTPPNQTHTSEDAPTRRLLQHVHPEEWKNPDPAPFYHLVVVGGGTAGLVAATGAATLGFRVALVERRPWGATASTRGAFPPRPCAASRRPQPWGGNGRSGIRTRTFFPPRRRSCGAFGRSGPTLRKTTAPTGCGSRAWTSSSGTLASCPMRACPRETRRSISGGRFSPWAPAQRSRRFRGSPRRTISPTSRSSNWSAFSRRSPSWGAAPWVRDGSGVCPARLRGLPAPPRQSSASPGGPGGG